jgi:putative ABC transport system permease protein
MKWVGLVRKNLRRRPLRTALTLGGVALAMVLLLLVESLSRGLDRAMSGTDAARTLIVYRANRYCPQTSILPQWYGERIAGLEGVASVLPLKIFLNNCRASLDIVTFQGAPADTLLQARSIDVIDGDVERFRSEHGAALVGRAFAARKGLDPGDQFRFGSIAVDVAGIFASDEPVEEGVILTHLDFLQRAAPVNQLGTVTEFEVELEPGADPKAVAGAIDALFASAEQPTDTRPQLLYLESATRDLREILRFARWLGLACAGVALVLVANTVVMSIQERVREFAVLRTLGFRERHVAGLVVGEALLLTLIGGGLGLAGALATVSWSDLTIGSEGVPVAFDASAALVLRGIAIAAATGVAAGLWPALVSARAPIVESLRSTA